MGLSARTIRGWLRAQGWQSQPYARWHLTADQAKLVRAISKADLGIGGGASLLGTKRIAARRTVRSEPAESAKRTIAVDEYAGYSPRMSQAQTAQAPHSGFDWVYVPVRAHYADRVLAYAGSLAAASGEAQGPEPLVDFPDGHLMPSSTPANPAGAGSFLTEVGNPNGVWTPEGYAALRGATTVSAIRAVRIGDALAETCGPIRLTTLAEATDMTPEAFRSALSKLSAFVKDRPAIYPQYVWPFGWRYGKSVSSEHPREFHYEMSTEQRDSWESGS